MSIEIGLATVIVVLAAICALLLCYDIIKHKTLRQLRQERAEVRKLKTELCCKKAIAIEEGKL